MLSIETFCEPSFETVTTNVDERTFSLTIVMASFSGLGENDESEKLEEVTLKRLERSDADELGINFTATSKEGK